MKKDLISIKDLSAQDINAIFKLTGDLKREKAKYAQYLKGKALALIFQKPSNRTRVSFAVGIFELGGLSVYLGPQEISLGSREAVKDVARTLSRYVAGIVLRTFEHSTVLEMAAYASVPVINGLSDLYHPCQALTDLYTIKEKKGFLRGLTMAYVGDGNNVANSLLYGCAKTGVNLRIASPKQYAPDKEVLRLAKSFAEKNTAVINAGNKPNFACKGADIIYTDVWTSMGQEKESRLRKKLFKDFQLNERLLSSARPDCLIMHCLPAHRGEEITDEVMESENSIIFDQAENRLHVQKAILIKLLKREKY